MQKGRTYGIQSESALAKNCLHFAKSMADVPLPRVPKTTPLDTRVPLRYPARFLPLKRILVKRQEAFASGQVALPRPRRNAATTEVSPGSVPEIRLGLGSRTAFLNGAIG